jgi:hypothetical protein
LDAWRRWVTDEGEMARRLDEARAARPLERAGVRPRDVGAVVASFRQTIGAILISLGQHMQGAHVADRAAETAAGQRQATPAPAST